MKASHDSYVTKEDRLDKVEDTMNDLKELLIKSFEKKEEKAEPVRAYVVEDKPDTPKSISDKEKFAWAGLGLILNSALVWIMWHNMFFSVAFALATVFLGLLLLVFVDWKFLKGDSLGKIAENGIAAAIFWVGIIILFCGGLWFGERISPDRLAGEAQQAVERRFDSFDNKLDSIKSNTVKPAKNEIEIGNDGIPNR